MEGRVFQSLHANGCLYSHSAHVCEDDIFYFSGWIVGRNKWSGSVNFKEGRGANEALPDWSIRITQALSMSSKVSVELSQPCSGWIKHTIKWIRFRGMFKHCGTASWHETEEQNKRKLLTVSLFLWKLKCFYEDLSCFSWTSNSVQPS